jgi:DNA invertase Pin-like site-specific DNA recombinase
VARGVKLGRKPKLTEHQKREAIRRLNHDGDTVREIVRSCNVSHSTISRLTGETRVSMPIGLAPYDGKLQWQIQHRQSGR